MLSIPFSLKENEYLKKIFLSDFKIFIARERSLLHSSSWLNQAEKLILK